ncbi:HD domain-containing protein [Microbacterium azadirachtae]|uniref:Multifunctional CCA protein n=1 Tax=Microbacterium azadirachtae TaxID=582680 RepID=A0A0F0LFQ5_9MICO|nr:HD domain-containing protein [Microbacterium azadirachtae]KJL31963.1 Multifunctional CCA protein [Microbacterium azadirachtae]
MTHANGPHSVPPLGHQADDQTGDALRRIARHATEPSKELLRERLIRCVPELAALGSVPQDPRWHPEGDVLTHSLLAVDAAAEQWDAAPRPIDRREIVVLAALFHDVGKPATTRSDGDSVTSHGHAELGGEIVLRIGSRLGWPDRETAAIAALVRHHMAHVSVQGDPTRKAVGRLRRRLTDAGTSLAEWSLVVAADGAARGSASTGSRAEPWLRVASSME